MNAQPEWGEVMAAAYDAAAHAMARLGLDHPRPMTWAEFVTAPPEVRAVTLLVLGEAWVLGESLLEDIAGADYAGGRYHRAHLLPALAELDRRRYPPTGVRELWIRYGPEGPPVALDDQGGRAA